VMPIEVVRGLEGEERPHAHDEGPEHLIANVEIVVGIATGFA
jgi:hypothetical protein